MTEYKLTFEIFGQKRRCSIKANSIEESKTILLEQVKKQVLVLNVEFTSHEQPIDDVRSAEEALAKIFGIDINKI